MADKVEKHEKPRAQSDEHADHEISVTLCESDTFWLLHIPGRCVANDSPEAVAVEEANGRYRQLLKGRQGSELYADVGIQTINKIVKAKEVQSISEACTSQYSQATRWEIHDALHWGQGDASEEVLFLPLLFFFQFQRSVSWITCSAGILTFTFFFTRVYRTGHWQILQRLSNKIWH